MIDFDGYGVMSFDCYGTLIDWEGGIVSGMRPTLSAHGVDATEEEIRALHARTEHRLQSASRPGAAGGRQESKSPVLYQKPGRPDQNVRTGAFEGPSTPLGPWAAES